MKHWIFFLLLAVNCSHILKPKAKANFLPRTVKMSHSEVVFLMSQPFNIFKYCFHNSLYDDCSVFSICMINICKTVSSCP